MYVYVYLCCMHIYIYKRFESVSIFQVLTSFWILYDNVLEPVMLLKKHLLQSY